MKCSPALRSGLGLGLGFGLAFGFGSEFGFGSGFGFELGLVLTVTVVPDLKPVAGVERHQAAAVRRDPEGQLPLLPGLSNDERRGIIVFERGVNGWRGAERCARVRCCPHTWRRHVQSSELLRSAVVAQRLRRARRWHANARAGVAGARCGLRSALCRSRSQSFAVVRANDPTAPSTEKSNHSA